MSFEFKLEKISVLIIRKFQRHSLHLPNHMLVTANNGIFHNLKQNQMYRSTKLKNLINVITCNTCCNSCFIICLCRPSRAPFVYQRKNKLIQFDSQRSSNTFMEIPTMAFLMEALESEE